MASRTADLRRRVLFVGVPVAVLTVLVAAFVASRIVTRQVERSAAREMARAARRVGTTVNIYLEERQTAVALLAALPAVIDRARTTGSRARVLGLDALPTAELEARYATSRVLEPDERVNGFLRRTRDDSDFAEIFFTERHGLVAAASDSMSDFARADETWWQDAMAAGSHQDPAEYDESAEAAAIGLATRIEDPETGEPIGVVKAVLNLSRLSRMLADPVDTTAMAIEIVDSAGRIVAASERGLPLGRVAERRPTLVLRQQTTVSTLELPGGSVELVASTPVNQGRWWVLAREDPTGSALAVAIRRAVMLASGGLLAVLLAFMWWLSYWLNRRVTRPVRMAGTIASRVASGDLSARVTQNRAGSDEVRLLLSSVDSMVGALRGLVTQIRSASEDSAAMAQEISASTQQMSASTQEMANTCQSLTLQATQEADTVRAAAEDAGRILSIATTLAEGAREAAARSSALTELASQHRERLVAGGEHLARLANDLERGAADAHALAAMSEEVQTFVKQAREIGVQTNMLALNAAIEASRTGGGDTRGFAVVADEVRKLATQASRAAAATSETVRNVLTTLQGTRDRLTHLVESSTVVRETAESAAGGLVEVAKAAEETSAWTEEISVAAREVRRLVEEITQRLDFLAQGTEGVVAAAEEIAASAQEQSASTQEIASSASQLADSAERLTGAVSSFRVLEAAPERSQVTGRAAD